MQILIPRDLITTQHCKVDVNIHLRSYEMHLSRS